MYILKFTFVFLTLLIFNACGETGFYFQASKGQVSILAQRKSIRNLINNSHTPSQTKSRLLTVERIRTFAISKLMLPDNGSYKSIVDLKRKYVVWNVYAAPKFSISLERWCFPFAGCVNYRGYFKREDAEEYAEALRIKGFDIYVAPVAAYSTLGWFKDPIFSTMLNRSDENLAGLIFHELAHAKIYLKNDTIFNESFATAVEYEGIRLWLKKEGKKDHFKKFLKLKNNKNEFIKLISKTRNILNKVYNSSIKNSKKKDQKDKIIKKMILDFNILNKKWVDDKRWIKWINNDLNNAKLASISTYYKYVPAFRQLLLNLNYNLEAFYKKVEKISKLEKNYRYKELQKILLTNL